ncbi:GNAT family N-acetyltransferase [uncultured Sneathiella sp.]|uniref:GNAT family N-acetyltransferase n=1 Tax=uncultured Sneathiella sp. TaxID=879315 RepID=UPI0030EB2F98|tara:strand:- start:34310 stop:35146 length:837 start_codon:yes stop_codon:yes gene_type:complete
MTSVDALTFDDLTPDDMEAVLSLSGEAGWTQVADDWRLMMGLGYCAGFRDPSGVPIASGVALPMDDRYGWISMILVTKSWQRKGLATKLVDKCCDWLEERGITPLLDATPAGRTVYSQMGFHDLLGISRWRREGGVSGGKAMASPAQAEALTWIAYYDAKVFGAYRPSILGDLMTRGPAFVADHEAGFLLGREGRGVTQLGPVSANDEAAAKNLLDTAIASISGTITIDAFDAQEGFASHLMACGFTVQRGFTRMIRGTVRTMGDPALAYAAAGPELG